MQPDERNWRGEWRDSEKKLVLEVLGRLPDEDRAAMDGVPLIKVDRMLMDATEAAPPPSPDGSPALPAAPAETWHTVAHFRHRIRTDDHGVTQIKEFMISRAALENPRQALGEQQAEARRTIAHEIGHVVEKHQYMTAMRRLHEEYRTNGKLWRELAAARIPAEEEQQRLAPLRRQLESFDQSAAAAQAASEAQHAAYLAAHSALQATVDAYNDAATLDAQKLLQAPLDKARAARESAEKVWRDSWQKVKNLHARKADYQATSYLPASRKYEDKAAVVTAKAAAVRAQDGPIATARTGVAAVYSEADRRTHRLRNFVTVATANGLTGDITPYATKEWPHNPGEYFAEAYAFFVLDRDKLREHSPALLDYFGSGAYRG